MAKDFVRLGEVPVIEEVNDTASVLVEQGGDIYRAPKSSVGGGAGSSDAVVFTAVDVDAGELECNHTFGEVEELIFEKYASAYFVADGIRISLDFAQYQKDPEALDVILFSLNLQILEQGGPYIAFSSDGTIEQTMISEPV